jgi:hypothetical protein
MNINQCRHLRGHSSISKTTTTEEEEEEEEKENPSHVHRLSVSQS